MEETYKVLVTENEQNIIFEELEEVERERSYGVYQAPEFGVFMLKTPEPVEKDIKFGIFKLGKIKGTLTRKDIYEDR